jgi:hypothetical protein
MWDEIGLVLAYEALKSTEKSLLMTFRSGELAES